MNENNVVSRDADPHHFNADTDPDPTFHYNGDPDLGSHRSYVNLGPPVYGPRNAFIVSVHELRRLKFEPLKLLNFDFDVDPDPDTASQNNADPDPQSWL